MSRMSNPEFDDDRCDLSGANVTPVPAHMKLLEKIKEQFGAEIDGRLRCLPWKDAAVRGSAMVEKIAGDLSRLGAGDAEYYLEGFVSRGTIDQLVYCFLENFPAFYGHRELNASGNFALMGRFLTFPELTDRRIDRKELLDLVTINSVYITGVKSAASPVDPALKKPFELFADTLIASMFREVNNAHEHGDLEGAAPLPEIEKALLSAAGMDPAIPENMTGTLELLDRESKDLHNEVFRLVTAPWESWLKSLRAPRDKSAEDSQRIIKEAKGSRRLFTNLKRFEEALTPLAMRDEWAFPLESINRTIAQSHAVFLEYDRWRRQFSGFVEKSFEYLNPERTVKSFYINSLEMFARVSGALRIHNAETDAREVEKLMRVWLREESSAGAFWRSLGIDEYKVDPSAGRYIAHLAALKSVVLERGAQMDCLSSDDLDVPAEKSLFLGDFSSWEGNPQSTGGTMIKLFQVTSDYDHKKFMWLPALRHSLHNLMERFGSGQNSASAFTSENARQIAETAAPVIPPYQADWQFINYLKLYDLFVAVKAREDDDDADMTPEGAGSGRRVGV